MAIRVAIANRLGLTWLVRLARELPDATLNFHATPGSTGALRALQAGDADIAIVFADAAYAAYTGESLEQPSAFRHLRGIAVLEFTSVHVLTPKHSPIRSVAELRGHRVAIGQQGGSTARTSELVLAAYGLGVDELSLELIPRRDAINRVANGTLDAAFVTSTFPTESVGDAARRGVTLLGLDTPIVELLQTEYPFFRPSVIPGHTYVGQAEAIRTVSVNTLLVCRAALAEPLVYEIAEALFAVWPQLQAERLSVQLDSEQAPSTPIPLHDGAARYYREKELVR